MDDQTNSNKNLLESRMTGGMMKSSHYQSQKLMQS